MGILEQIEAAGIVGCGGAGFPTHRKLTAGTEYFIVNGAECEPLLRTDRWLMRNQADALIRATEALGRELHFGHLVVAVKAHYEEEIAALRQAIAQAGSTVTIHELESFYPAGDEQTIVYEVTGRVVPPAGLPGMVGAIVNNVATVYAISQAMDGIPFTEKYLTVTGAVRTPTVLRVPLGTSYAHCIDLAGGALEPSYFCVNGGPMMGKPVPMAEATQAVVTKTTSGILVLPAQGYHARTSQVDLTHMLSRARSACIQCSYCTQLCPRHLLGHPLEPHRIMRAMASSQPVADLLNDPVIRLAQLCCECGICEVYACPMGLFPRKINTALKKELAAAKLRWQAPDQTWTPSPLRDDRKAPSQRVAARAGVSAYYDYEIHTLRTGDPDRVALPLQMHIGAPAVPVVSPGDRVQAGDVIARPPEGALGALLHASLTGRVEAVDGQIIIVKE